MVRLRVRTKLLLSLLIVSIGLSATTLLSVRHIVRNRILDALALDLNNSVATFKNFQQQQETTLFRSAKLVADLPSLRALMTTQDPVTIQDGSSRFWNLSGSDLFVLGDRNNKIVAMHSNTLAFSSEIANPLFQASLREDTSVHYWFGEGHLYEIVLQPIYFGSEAEGDRLGVLAAGHEIDQRAASQVSQVATGKVAFSVENQIVASTLSSSQNAQLFTFGNSFLDGQFPRTTQISLEGEKFLATSLNLSPGQKPGIRLTVLKSYDRASYFLYTLNQLLLALGLLAAIVGTACVLYTSQTVTRPLEGLVDGVRALEAGDFTHPVLIKGSDEVAELAGAFARMRINLRKTQENLIDAERLAVIGQMANSISHDLRHQLSAILANAEFLSDAGLDQNQREELFQEVRSAVNDMTDLIDSLLEFSKTRESLHPSHERLEPVIERAIAAIRAHPEHQSVTICFQGDRCGEGWFDAKKLERALYNVILNASQAAFSKRRGTARVEVKAWRNEQELFEISVSDNGPGVSNQIRDRLFEPFVSFGKENGTGLGLTISQKIIQEHGGVVTLESAPGEGAEFRILFPAIGVKSGGTEPVPQMVTGSSSPA